jgi:hypothetical protein
MSGPISPGQRLFREIVARASPKDNHHARSGLESKISGSKAYGLVPTLYSADKAKGYKGIPLGLMANEPYMERPKFPEDSPRKIIHGLVFPMDEKVFTGYGKMAVDYGNAWEECAFRFFCCAYGGEAVSTGRIDCLDPEYPYACATPDGIWWDSRTDQVWVLEIKMPFKREIRSPKCTAADRRVNAVHPAAGFLQYSTDPDCPRVHYQSIFVKDNEAKFPGEYAPQLLLEMKSTGLLGAKVIQFEPGYDFHDPVLFVTDYMLDERILAPLHIYWSRAWAIVQRGREMYRYLIALQDQATAKGDVAEIAKTAEVLTAFQANFPWPAPAPKQTDQTAIERMPYIWDKFEEVTREQEAAMERLSSRK